MEIVGVVGSVRHHGLEVPGQLQYYRPYEQAAQGRLSLVIETSGDQETLAPLVRAEIRDIDPDQALYNLKTLESSAVESIWMNKLFSQLMWVFALAAGCVAAVGIYGVTAYSVSRRTHELGVRMALGAHRAHIMRMVVRQSMTVVFIGIGIGLAMASPRALCWRQCCTASAARIRQPTPWSRQWWCSWRSSPPGCRRGAPRDSIRCRPSETSNQATGSRRSAPGAQLWWIASADDP